MNINSKFTKPVIIFFVTLILILITLFSGENVILTNNGDYNRIVRLCSLENHADGEISIVLTGDGFAQNIKNILFTPADISTYPSSQIIFTRISVAMNFIINHLTSMPLNTYNVFYLGILMSILYALVLTFFLSQINIKNKYLNIPAILISIVILCDIGYISYFNSLYAEGIQHLLLIAIAGFMMILIKRQLKTYELIAFALILVLYGQSKFFNIPVAAIITVVFLLLSFRYNLKKNEKILNISAFILMIVLLTGTMASLPDWISNETNYNSVFYGIIKDCNDEQAKDYLKNDLGLDPQLHVLNNTHHYVSDFVEIEQNYNIKDAEEISKLKLVSFYLKHPIVSIKKLPEISQHSGVLRNIFFMNENYMNDHQRLVYWSKFRENSGFDTLLLNFAIILLFMIVFICTLKNKKTNNVIIAAAACLVLMIFAYTFIVPYISNGKADLAKHMYTFIEFLDLALIFVIVALFNAKKNNKIAIASILLVVFMVVNTPWSKIESISFGGYDWYVIEQTNDYKTLIAKDIVTKRSYNQSKDNNYERSDINRWLNNDFLNGFSQKEKDMLYCKQEKIILSKEYVKESTFGNRDFYCSALPKNVENNYDSAYSTTVSAYAFLPTAQHISLMAKKGFDVSLKEKYWLSTPYFNNSQKQRYVNPDGLVYFDYTSEQFGIRPVIYIKNTK